MYLIEYYFYKGYYDYINDYIFDPPANHRFCLFYINGWEAADEECWY